MVFFEAPHRTEAALTAMAEVFGADRAAAVCRELTKTHEEVRRGPLADRRQRLGHFNIGGIVAAGGEGDGVLTGISQHMKFM